MPFKKGRKTKSNNTKEKKAIATRLMVISLKIDDYIYKHKPISVQEAQMYIGEIAQLKLKCANDERSLQVIGKLNLFLKCIVEESTSSNNPNENFSIAQNIGAETISNENTSVSTVNVMTNINDENNVKEGTLGGSHNIENKNQNSSGMNTQNGQMETPNLSIDHSESIPNNNTDITKIIEINDGKAIEFDKESTFTAFNKSNHQNEPIHMAVDECNINTIDLTKTNVINNNIEKTFNHDKTIEKNNILTATTIHNWECSSKNINDTNENTTKINDKQNKTEETTKISNRKPRNKRTNSKEVKSNDTNKDKKNSNTKKITKKKFEVPKKKSDNANKINTDTHKIFNANNNSGENKPNENKTNKVVNKETIDISWVENIKYVREVCKEEYATPANSLEETFWRDHTLPVDWNFNDFDYTD